MRIADGWHLLLGRHGDEVLSDPYDCCVFALETGDGLVVFDAGADTNAAAFGPAIEGIADAGRGIRLLVTHGHADHSGGAAAIRQGFDARVLAGAQTAGWLENADEDAISLGPARDAGIYPADYRLAACPVDAWLADGETLEIGDARIEVVATPGHSADHMSFLVEARGRRVLVAGDALFDGGRVVLQDTWDSSVAGTCASVRRLAALRFDAMLSGHGALVLANAADHVAAAMERVSRFLPPLNLM